MANEILFIAGGAALAAIIVALIILRTKNSSKSVVAAMDEQYMVQNLTGADLKTWFAAKNPDGKYTNLIMALSPDIVGSMNISETDKQALNKISEETGNCIIQAVVDPNNDSEIVCCRACVYETMSEKLENLLKENNGTLIIE